MSISISYPTRRLLSCIVPFALDDWKDGLSFKIIKLLLIGGKFLLPKKPKTCSVQGVDFTNEILSEFKSSLLNVLHNGLFNIAKPVTKCRSNPVIINNSCTFF